MTGIGVGRLNWFANSILAKVRKKSGIGLPKCGFYLLSPSGPGPWAGKMRSEVVHDRFFFISLSRVRNSGPLDYIGNLVNFIGKVIKHISCCYGVPAPGLARDMIPTSERRGLYVLISFPVYQNLQWDNATVVRVRFSGAL